MGDTINLDELLKGSVDHIKEGLANVPTDHLATLHALEGKGANRSTLIAAIDAEQKARAAQETTGAETFTREQVDEMLATREATYQAAVNQLAAEHARELAEARGQSTSPSDEVIATAAANGAVALAALKSETSIRFFDRDGVAVDTLPAMTFGPRDFEPNGNRIMLMREVEFPVGLPERDVAGAVLFEDDGDDDAEPIGRAELVQPFGIGGGRPAKLPPRTLSFG